MTAMCTPYQMRGATTTDSSNGADVREPAREADEGRPAATVTKPDSSVLRLIQDKEVIRNG
jgi:hypothetical protein